MLDILFLSFSAECLKEIGRNLQQQNALIAYTESLTF